MPESNRRSRGCQACKDRKVKCDETLPSCRRCQRNDRQCPGYPSSSDIAFRNTFSTEITRRSRSPSLARDAFEFGPSSISAPLATDWQSQAVCAFLHNYVVQPDESNLGFGFLSGLSDWVAKDAALQETVSAGALMSLAHRSSSYDDLVPEARQLYGKALKLAATSLSNPEMIKKDSTLAMILCLGIFEMVSGDVPPGKDMSSHVGILEYLLRVRRSGPPESGSSGLLNYNAHIYLVMRNLTKRLPPSKESEMILSGLREDLPMRRLGGIVSRICHALPKADQLLGRKTFDNGPNLALSEIIGSSIQLDKELSVWSSETFQEYPYTIIQAPGSSCSPRTSPGLRRSVQIHHYPSIPMAYMWNMYRTARIQLLHCLMQCLVRARQHHMIHYGTTEATGMPSDAKKEIQALINDVISSVPYLLGEVDPKGRVQYGPGKAVGGFFLLWPLQTALFLDSVDSVQKQWIKKRLAYIDHVLGIHWATHFNSAPATVGVVEAGNDQHGLAK